MVMHNALMSRWLAQSSAWQYFIIAWAIALAAALSGALLFAVVSGHVRTGEFEFVPFGSLLIAAGATLGRQIRKRI
jgi:hypothetical protein